MQELERIVHDLFARMDGPLHFRFIVQPLMAITFAIVDGVKDAKARKRAYFWALVSTSGDRKQLMKDGWKSIGRIFILAIILDSIYQMKVHSNGAIYAGELVIVAFLLAIVPYLIVRGPANRIACLVIAREHKDAEIASTKEAAAGPEQKTEHPEIARP